MIGRFRKGEMAQLQNLLGHSSHEWNGRYVLITSECFAEDWGHHSLYPGVMRTYFIEAPWLIPKDGWRTVEPCLKKLPPPPPDLAQLLIFKAEGVHA